VISPRTLAVVTVLVVAGAAAGCSQTPHATASQHTSAPFATGPSTTSTTLFPPASTSTSTTLPRFSGFLAQSVTFVTPDIGFVLGDVECPTGACLALRKTTDRGATWTPEPPPPAALGESEDSFGPEMQFADASDGWAYGATLWATHDGSQHWHRVDIGGTVAAMASGDGEAYALVEHCTSSAVCNEAGSLYRSPVGQDAWVEVPGVSGQFNGGQDSLVVEGDTVFVMAAFPTPELLGSTDGVHFTNLDVPCSTSAADGLTYMPGALAASDPADLAMVCLGSPGAGSQFKQAFISHDGGRDFEVLPDPTQAGLGAGLAMPSPTTLLLGTSSAGTSVSRMAAPDAAWTNSIGFSDGGAGFSDLAFIDPSDGAFIHGPASIAVSLIGSPDAPPDLGQLYLTDNAGVSWTSVAIP
jgi:hypothetical protein